MANNPPFSGAPGPPLHPPMIGSVGPLQNLPPPMPTQFRPVASVRPAQQFSSSVSQQYQLHGAAIPTMNVGMLPPQTQQMQFVQSIQQAPPRSIPPGHPPPISQSMPLTNIQLNRPLSSGLPQPVQSMQSLPPSYAPVAQMNLQNDPVSGPPSVASGNQGIVSVAPVHLDEPSSAATSTLSVEREAVKQASSDWLEHINNGRRYYYNKKTKKSTWEKPWELMTLVERADATTDWKEYQSPDGKRYYYNKATNQSKWTIPDELKLAREQTEKASTVAEVAASFNASEFKKTSDDSLKSASPAVQLSPATAVPPTSLSPGLAALPSRSLASRTESIRAMSPPLDPSPVHVQVQANVPLGLSEFDAPSANEANTKAKQVAEETPKITAVVGKLNVTPSEEKPFERETPTYANKQEAKDAFKSLLESVNVESDWTWEQAMRLIINDKRYAALKSLGERKQAFSEYLSQRKKQEAEERRARNRKAKEDFKKMLEECSELTSTTRWGKAINMFGDDERFKAIERARDRQDMFEEYMAELETKELAKAEEERQQNIMEYRKFLESCDFIKANSQWRKVKDRLEPDERCSRLETIDRLKIFQEYIGDLEKEEEEQRRLQKEEIRKSERKNRDEFRKLMEEHVADGTLTSKSHWRDYHSQIKDLPAYQSVSSNSSGSTPKELFEDVVEELKKQYQEDRTRIKDAVKSEKVVLSSTWTLEDFKIAIANEISSSEVSENNLKVVFEELLERAREKEEKEAKRRKRLGDEFFNMLCSLKDLTSESKWEECLPLFEACDEFRSIGDESFSKQIFDEYLEQLKEKEKERKRKEDKARKEKERERDRRSKDRREKDRKHDRDRGRERFEKEEGDGESDFNDLSNESRKAGRDKDKKHRKRHQDEDNDVDIGKDRSRSSHRHSSERKRSRQVDQYGEMLESDNESKHKKHKREHRNGSRKRSDTEELEDGELGYW